MDVLDLELRLSISTIIETLQTLGFAVNPLFQTRPRALYESRGTLNSIKVKTNKEIINQLRLGFLGESLILEQK